MSLKNLIIAFLLGIALAAGIWTAVNMQRANATLLSATLLPAPAELPQVSLLNHEAQAIDEQVFAGQWDLVFFGFTHCPDICPVTLQVLSAAKRQLIKENFESLPRIVLVTVDPERDTPAKLADYISAFGDGNLGITGDPNEIRKLTSSLGIYFQKQDSGDEYYSVDHSAVVIVMDPEGRFHSLFSSPHVIENYVHDLPLLVKRRGH
jgi:protein SCO1/2